MWHDKAGNDKNGQSAPPTDQEDADLDARQKEQQKKLDNLLMQPAKSAEDIKKQAGDIELTDLRDASRLDFLNVCRNPDLAAMKQCILKADDERTVSRDFNAVVPPVAGGIALTALLIGIGTIREKRQRRELGIDP
jgi:hypothetical protein